MDRARDVWVGVLSMLVRKSGEAKDAKMEMSGKRATYSLPCSTRFNDVHSSRGQKHSLIARFAGQG